MGFFKRVMSLGSKKNKKPRPEPAPEMPTIKVDQLGYSVRPSAEEDAEAVASQLLRSSSSRYTVGGETNYNDLPPIPHPINKVIAPPAASSASLASSTNSQRGIYTVKVHPRQRHSSTELPMSIPDEEELETQTPRKTDNLLRLRSDPSVASLLDLYDSHGALADDAFSNSPEKQVGRAQVRRSGSTLRQLMGAYPSRSNTPENASSEGDISWAERFLRETECASSASSDSLQTPESADVTQLADHQITVQSPNDTVSSIQSSSVGNQTISSMNVEVSDTEMSHDDSLEIVEMSDMPASIPKTPRRASQVFNFLTQKRSTSPAPPPAEAERPLPDLPSYFSSPSDDGHAAPAQRGRSRSSGRSSTHSSTVIPSNHSTHSAKHYTKRSTSRTDRTPVPVINISEPMTMRSSSRSQSRSHSRSPSRSSSSGRGHRRAHERTCGLPPNTPDPVLGVLDPDGPRPVNLIHKGQTKVVVTAPTPSNHNNGPSSTRIPRGPRSQKHSTEVVADRRPTLLDRSNSQDSYSDPFVVNDKPPRRSNSGSSSSVLDFNRRSSQDSHSRPSTSSDRERPSRRSKKHAVDDIPGGKENALGQGLAAKVELPFTPLRNLHRSAIDHTIFQPPSPASSTDLSPVGKKIMYDLRMQKKAEAKAHGVKESRERRVRASENVY